MPASPNDSAGVAAYKAPEVAEGQGKTNQGIKHAFNTFFQNTMKRVIYFHTDVLYSSCFMESRLC